MKLKFIPSFIFMLLNEIINQGNPGENFSSWKGVYYI